MKLGELRSQFISLRQYEPDLNMLLDFARQGYLHGSICISDYRNIIRELEEIGATKPDFSDSVTS